MVYARPLRKPKLRVFAVGGAEGCSGFSCPWAGFWGSNQLTCGLVAFSPLATEVLGEGPRMVARRSGLMSRSAASGDIADLKSELSMAIQAHRSRVLQARKVIWWTVIWIASERYRY